MKKTAWTIYNQMQAPQDWRFFATKTACQKEIDRIFKGLPSLVKLGDIKPVKVLLDFDI